jgi:type IV fimbrial biogenesis protein FimT
VLIRRESSRGFTIIELMIALTLFSVLAVLAVPAFTDMLQNQKIRSKAESITAGLQTARQEALRLNQPVTFALVLALPEANASSVDANPVGQDWVVAQVPGGGDPIVVFGSQVSGESGGERPPHLILDPVGAPGSIVFSPLGDTDLDEPTIFNVWGPTGNPVDCKPAGKLQCLAIEVSPTGQIRMCNPEITAIGDTRKCPSTPPA